MSRTPGPGTGSGRRRPARVPGRFGSGDRLDLCVVSHHHCSPVSSSSSSPSLADDCRARRHATPDAESPIRACDLASEWHALAVDACVCVGVSVTCQPSVAASRDGFMALARPPVPCSCAHVTRRDALFL
jgi:hypothetical protein